MGIARSRVQGSSCDSRIVLLHWSMDTMFGCLPNETGLSPVWSAKILRSSRGVGSPASLSSSCTRIRFPSTAPSLSPCLPTLGIPPL